MAKTNLLAIRIKSGNEKQFKDEKFLSKYDNSSCYKKSFAHCVEKQKKINFKSVGKKFVKYKEGIESADFDFKKFLSEKDGITESKRNDKFKTENIWKADVGSAPMQSEGKRGPCKYNLRIKTNENLKSNYSQTNLNFIGEKEKSFIELEISEKETTEKKEALGFEENIKKQTESKKNLKELAGLKNKQMNFIDNNESQNSTICKLYHFKNLNDKKEEKTEVCESSSDKVIPSSHNIDANKYQSKEENVNKSEKTEQNKEFDKKVQPEKSVKNNVNTSQSNKFKNVKKADDKTTSCNVNNNSLECLANSSLPNYLFLKRVDADHGLSVFTKRFIRKCTYFGPLIGKKVKEMDIRDDFNMKDIWEVHLVDGISYISTQDSGTSNWLKFIRPAESKERANLMTFVENGNLYFNTVKNIYTGAELVYWVHNSPSSWSQKKLQRKSCGGCNLQFTHTLYFRKHCFIFHDPNITLATRKYYCKVCGVAVLGKEKIMKHAAEMHQGKGAYQCQYCHKFFLRFNYLDIHRTYGCSKNPQRSKPLCDLCGRKFCQPQKLKIHIKRMHSEDIEQVLKEFQCKNCEKILGSGAALQRHMKEVHKKDIVGSFTCDRCGKVFQNKSNLKIHMLTHSGVKPFRCQEKNCLSAFTTKQCLQFHYKKVHHMSDEGIPKIERSVEYTFDAYSGGSTFNPEKDSSPVLDNSQRQDNSLNSSLHDSLDSPKVKPNIIPTVLSKGTAIITRLDKKYINTLEESSRKESYLTIKKLNSKEISDDSNFFLESNSHITKVNNESSETTLKKILPDRKDFSRMFFSESSNNSLLMETTTNVTKEDLNFKEPDGGRSSNVIIDSRSEMHSSNNFENNSSDVCRSFEEKKVVQYQKSDDCQNNKSHLMSNFHELIKYNTWGNNLNSTMQEQEANSEVEIENNPDRDLVHISRKNDLTYDSNIHTYQNENGDDDDCNKDENGDIIRSEKFVPYKESELDSRLRSMNKFECREGDFSNEQRIPDRRESTDFEINRLEDVECRSQEMYVEVERQEEKKEAQNLCCKKKFYHNIEESPKVGWDSSGFDHGDTKTPNSENQSFTSSLFRNTRVIVSPRSYNTSGFESEIVDLRIRPPFSASPVYTLDLTPSRVDFPSRHTDFRTHPGSPVRRLGTSTCGVTDYQSAQGSLPNYGLYQSYELSEPRNYQIPQFQHYTPLYY